MTNLAPEHHAPKEIEGPLISTGMGRGLHVWIATVLTIAAVALGLAAQAFTSFVLALLFLAAATGLLGEVPRLLASGEVRARVASHGDPAKANRFLVIRRDDSPGRFYLFVVTYIVLGGFALLLACAFLVPILVH